MKKTTLFLTLCLCLVPTASALAQDEPQLQKEEDFKLYRYSPQWVRADSLLRTMDTLFGRRLQFEDRAIDNLSLLDESVVIYESGERLATIIQAIEQLDVDPYGDEAEEELPEVSTKSFSADVMVVESYLPQYFQAKELYRIASELYGREVQVDGSWHSNLQLTSNSSLIVYEEQEAARELLQKIAEIDTGLAPLEESQLVVREYLPRHVSPKGLLDGVQSFYAQVQDFRGGNHMMSSNISQVRERGLILIRDHPERAEEILQVLAKLDQPAPQMMLVFQVLRGVAEQPQHRAQSDVEQELRKVLPYDYYQVAGSGMLRAGMTAGTELELRMDADIGHQGRFQLKMEVGSFDQDEDALKLDDCELSLRSTDMQESRQLFSTSATVYRGEYAVLGVTGAEPLFLVVQVVPVERP